MRILVLVLNYFFLFFLLMGLVYGITNSSDSGISWEVVVGPLLFIVLIIVNLIYIHRLEHPELKK